MGGLGRDIFLGGVYLVSRNSSEYVFMKKSSHVYDENVGVLDLESEKSFFRKAIMVSIKCLLISVQLICFFESSLHVYEFGSLNV